MSRKYENENMGRLTGTRRFARNDKARAHHASEHVGHYDRDVVYPSVSGRRRVGTVSRGPDTAAKTKTQTRSINGTRGRTVSTVPVVRRLSVPTTTRYWSLV